MLFICCTAKLDYLSHKSKFLLFDIFSKIFVTKNLKMLSEKASELLFKEDDFNKIGKLPENGYSESYLAEVKSDKRKVVLKYAKLMSEEACNSDGSAKKSFYDQLHEKASTLLHPCLCPIEGYTVPTEKRIPIIISSYCKNGPLNNESMNRLSQSKKWIVAIGIASAIKYLHQQDILYLRNPARHHKPLSYEL